MTYVSAPKDGVPPHSHHWYLDTPTGPTVLGRCVKCQAIKEFPAWDDRDSLTAWNDTPKLRKRGR